MTLNQPQKNSLEIELRHLERALRVARLLMTAPEIGILIHRLPVSQAARQRLEPIIEQIMTEIATLAEKFQLQPEADDPLSTLNAEMAVAWSDLYDMLSPKLKRYGEVDPALTETLDPHIKKLISLTYAITQAAKE